ncbi:MAG: tetratricopeptide repeat protein [Proteobacteria bacterium]|nr:tetratricopeptide repeat protein [Pseudomonadota bacterium]
MLDDIIELHRAGRLSEAEAGYRELLGIDPDDAEVLHLLGIVRGQRGDAAEGVALVERAIDRDPQRAVFRYTLGEMQLHAGHLDSAEKAYLRAKELNPNLTNAHTGLGQIAFLRGQLEDAESHFRIALRADENDAQSLAGLGNIAFTRNELTKASRYLAEAAKLAANDALIQGSLANVMLAMNTPDFAVRAANNALALKPDYAMAWNILGNALLQKGDAQGAGAAFEALLAQGEQLAAAHLGLGDIARLQQRHEDAIAQYEQALRNDPDLHLAAIRRADSLARSGRAAEAISGLVDRAARYPQAGYPRVAVATLLGQQGRHAEALPWWREASPLLPDDANAQAGFALALERAGEYEAALQQVRRIPPGGGQSPGLAMLRARGALRNDDASEALQALQALEESQWQELPALSRRRWKLVGLAQDKLGQWAQAVRAFEATLRESAVPLPELPELDAALLARIHGRADARPLQDRALASPVLLVGLPGAGLPRLAALLGEQPQLRVRRQRRVPGSDVLSSPFEPRLLQPLDEAALHRLQRRYARVLQRETSPGGALVIDWVSTLDARVLPALKQALPGVRLLRVAGDPRDALLNWLAFGGDSRGIEGDPVSVARWMKRQLAHHRLATELLPSHVLEDVRAADPDAGGDAARALAVFLGIGELAPGSHVVERNRAGMPVAFPPGHWRQYREALAGAFAELE